MLAEGPPDSGAPKALSLPRRRKRKTEQEPTQRRKVPRCQQSWFKRQILRADEEDEDADSDEIARQARNNDSVLATQTLENESSSEKEQLRDQGPNVGCLTAAQRLAKVQSYLTKKAKRKAEGNKHIYKFRQQVATKRLRIRGRFVTRD